MTGFSGTPALNTRNSHGQIPGTEAIFGVLRGIAGVLFHIA
jgi:hypothetical protein